MIVKSVTSFLRRERKLHSATSLWRVRVSLKFGQISEVQFFYTELEALVVTQLAVRNWNCEQVQNLKTCGRNLFVPVSSCFICIAWLILQACAFSTAVSTHAYKFLRFAEYFRNRSWNPSLASLPQDQWPLSAREDTKKDGNQHNRCILESSWRRPVPCELVLSLLFFFLWIILLLKKILVKSIMIEIFVNGRFQLSRNSRPLKYWTIRFVLHCSAEHQST